MNRMRMRGLMTMMGLKTTACSASTTQIMTVKSQKRSWPVISLPSMRMPQLETWRFGSHIFSFQIFKELNVLSILVLLPCMAEANIPYHTILRNSHGGREKSENSAGCRVDLSCKPKFQQDMKIWCLGTHEMCKWKNSVEGLTLLMIDRSFFTKFK